MTIRTSERGAQLQGGRGLSAAETTASGVTVNEFTALLQGGRGLSAAETRLIEDLMAETGWLQGGRGLSAAETPTKALHRAPALSLQGGRGLSAAETWWSTHPWMRLMALQGGRGLSAAETAEKIARALADNPASMRPRPFGRGNGRVLGRSRRRAPGFNEAAAFRPRKPGSPRFASRRSSRFNEAAAFRPRKRPVVGMALDPSRASMRPRPFGRGNRHGAAPWRAERLRASMRPRPFGRGNGDVPALIAPLLDASMRPRPFGRGNAYGGMMEAAEVIRFNEAAAFRPRKP